MLPCAPPPSLLVLVLLSLVPSLFYIPVRSVHLLRAAATHAGAAQQVPADEHLVWRRGRGRACLRRRWFRFRFRCGGGRRATSCRTAHDVTHEAAGARAEAVVRAATSTASAAARPSACAVMHNHQLRSVPICFTSTTERSLLFSLLEHHLKASHWYNSIRVVQSFISLSASFAKPVCRFLPMLHFRLYILTFSSLSYET